MGLVLSNLKNRKYIDAYVIAVVSVAFALMSLIGDVVPVNMRWAVLLGGVGLLVYRVTVPEERAGHLLHDRSSFDRGLLIDHLTAAREFWVFAPTAVNVLTAQNCDRLRHTVLARHDGLVRVVLLSPKQGAALDIAERQLDAYTDFPVHNLRSALEATLAQLERMCAWQVPGAIEYRVFDFNPGFSLVAVDPHGKSALLIVEFHAVQNVSTSQRMHLQLTPADGHWFTYWLAQFSVIWNSATSVRQHNPSP